MSDKEFLHRYGPCALVTGASSGIGKAFAHLLAAKGFDLVLVARRTHLLEQLAAQVTGQHKVAVKICATDLADAAAAESIIAAAGQRDIGLVISNAGFGLKGAFELGDPKTLANMLMVNCNAPMALARGLLPRLRQRGRGGIIFTSSVEGLLGMPNSAVYAATKAFVNSLGEALWAECAPDGIEVLTLCPGATDTEAPRLQGIDVATLRNVMSADAVAELALENIGNGPVYIPSEHYRASFERLLSMPRRDALTMMASSMKKI